MSDLGATTWTEVDANNNALPPNGWPEGMNPSDVNNAARAEMGGEKRFWVRTNSVFSTAGTTTAYTLTYGQAAAAYYDGEEFSIIINATCGTAPSLNINGLGARNLRKFVVGLYMTLVAGDLAANQQIRVRYNLSATTFDIISGGPTGWTQIPSAVGFVDFATIPATVNNLSIRFDLTPATNAVNLALQFYNSGGSLDTTGVYSYMNKFVSTSVTETITANASVAAMLMSGAVANSTSISGTITISEFQQVRMTKANWSNAYLDSGGTFHLMTSGGGLRTTVGPITGFRLAFSSGNESGRVTVKEF